MGIEIKNITKSFDVEEGKFVAVKDINFKIKDGEIVGILGPSGCGKTTILRMIAGLDKPTEGEIYNNEELIKDPSKDKGFIFQQYSLFPWLTVIENISFSLKLEKKPKEEIEKLALEYLDIVGLREFKNHYPHELSGGMKQRVAIVRSLINNPSILLMDEPFSAIDMQNRRKLQEVFIKIQKDIKMTTVFVSHDVDEAVFLADKIVVLSKNPGKIKEIIDIPLKHPRNRSSHEFLEIQAKISNLLGVLDQ